MVVFSTPRRSSHSFINSTVSLVKRDQFELVLCRQWPLYTAVHWEKKTENNTLHGRHHSLPTNKLTRETETKHVQTSHARHSAVHAQVDWTSRRPQRKGESNSVFCTDALCLRNEQFRSLPGLTRRPCWRSRFHSRCCQSVLVRLLGVKHKVL